MADGIQQVGKLILVVGVVCIVIGAVLVLYGRIPWLGRLPGDIYIREKNFTFYFPLATSILVSILLTLLLWMFGRR
jgi:Protein of unknown function (DUF2905)